MLAARWLRDASNTNHDMAVGSSPRSDHSSGSDAAGSLAVRVEGLTKDFGAHRSVDGLSFEIPAGGVTGFVGPNGSGKSTTLRMLLGLFKPTAGNGWVLGRNVETLDQSRSGEQLTGRAWSVQPCVRKRRNPRVVRNAGTFIHWDAVVEPRNGLTSRVRHPIRGDRVDHPVGGDSSGEAGCDHDLVGADFRSRPGEMESMTVDIEAAVAATGHHS